MQPTNLPERCRPRRSKAIATVLVVLSMVIAFAALSMPSADAHAGKFEHADQVFVETGCPEGTVPNGVVGVLFGRDVMGCDHPGYSPILGDIALCEEATGMLVAGVCTFDRAVACGERPAFLYEIGDGMCLRPALVRNACLGTTNFVDVLNGLYFSDPVKWAECEGITSGTTASTFSPTNSVRRGQLAVMLWRYAGSPAAQPHSFTDVPVDTYYNDAIAWMSETGITTGTTATTFSPATPVTRAQMATFMWRYSGEPVWAPISPFTDVPEGAYFSEAVEWMSGTGITTGTTATTFSPNDTANRAQAVTFLWRMAGRP